MDKETERDVAGLMQEGYLMICGDLHAHYHTLQEALSYDCKDEVAKLEDPVARVAAEATLELCQDLYNMFYKDVDFDALDVKYQAVRARVLAAQDVQDRKN